MSDTTFTRVPHPASDALQRGEISLLQFTILVMMHAAADWKTGVVKSWSAAECLYRMGNPDVPSLKTVKRAMEDLRSLGWYHDDWVKGSKRPYNATLHNFVVYGPIHDPDHEKTEADDHETIVRNPYEIKTYKDRDQTDDHEKSHGHDHDIDHERHGQMSLKDQIGSQPSASPQPPPAVSDQQPSGQSKAEGTEAYDRLLELAGWLPEKTAPKIIARLLQKFTLNEIADVIHPPKARQSQPVPDPDETKKLFANDGAKLQYWLHEERKKAEDRFVRQAVTIGVTPDHARAAVKEHGINKVLEDLQTDLTRIRKGKS